MALTYLIALHSANVGFINRAEIQIKKMEYFLSTVSWLSY